MEYSLLYLQANQDAQVIKGVKGYLDKMEREAFQVCYYVTLFVLPFLLNGCSHFVISHTVFTSGREWGMGWED